MTRIPSFLVCPMLCSSVEISLLDEYLASLQRVKVAIHGLSLADLPSCRRVLEDLKHLHNKAIACLEIKYRVLLSSVSTPINVTKYLSSFHSGVGEENNSVSSGVESSLLIPPEQVFVLLKLATGIQESMVGQAHPGYIAGYSDTRSMYMKVSLDSLYQSTLAFERKSGTAYSKGSHPFIFMAHMMIKMVKAEILVCRSIIPPVSFRSALTSITSTIFSILYEIADSIIEKSKKNFKQNGNDVYCND